MTTTPENEIRALLDDMDDSTLSKSLRDLCNEQFQVLFWLRCQRDIEWRIAEEFEEDGLAQASWNREHATCLSENYDILLSSLRKFVESFVKERKST